MADHLDPLKCREAKEAFNDPRHPLYLWAQRYIKSCPACKEELIEGKVPQEEKE